LGLEVSGLEVSGLEMPKAENCRSTGKSILWFVIVTPFANGHNV
jgi:hypothetical protein